MRISEVIRNYRKKENLTQEQVANYLNISAPAVNKWESGISYPDITKV
jgi:transcriptional regulator with XRE-family HTH domain